MSAQMPPPSPWDTPPPARPPRPNRPWYKKKRFIIPGATLALFILIGVLNPAAPATPTASKATSTAVAATEAPTTQALTTDPPTTEAATTSTAATQPPTTAAPPRAAAPTTHRAPATSPSTTHRQPTTTHPTPTCDLSYPDVCLHDGIGDYDCTGGSGNGPNYVDGPIQVRPPDPFGLDGDGNGIGCQS